jgi:hypothetical protein
MNPGWKTAMPLNVMPDIHQIKGNPESPAASGEGKNSGRKTNYGRPLNLQRARDRQVTGFKDLLHIFS